MNINKIKRTKSKDDFSVGFVNPSKNEKQNIDGLGLAVLYDKHKDYVMDLIEKSTSYGSLEQNQALSDGFQGLFRTPQEVFDFVWGKYLNEEEWKDVYTPMSQMFIPRKAFDPTVLSMRQKGKCKIHIRYYDESGSINPVANLNDFDMLYGHRRDRVGYLNKVKTHYNLECVLLILTVIKFIQ